MGGTVRALICEGFCNGEDLKRFDAQIRAAGRAEMERPGQRFVSVSLVSQQTIELGRSLRHTAHEEYAPGVYACLSCGTHRRFGNRIV